MAGRESSDAAELLAALMLLTDDQRKEWLRFSVGLHANKEQQRDLSQPSDHRG